MILDPVMEGYNEKVVDLLSEHLLPALSFRDRLMKFAAQGHALRRNLERL